MTAGIPAVIEEVTPGGSVYYIREPNGGLVARVAGGNTHYYHFDALGSTRLLTDNSGLATDAYSYDAWGNAAHNGQTAQPYQYVGQLGYYTHVQDENTSLLQLGVRFYDPETGRFTQRDPIAISPPEPSTYTYALNIATSYADPTGLKPKLKGWLKKAYKCGKKAFDACRNKSGKDYEKCYWKEFGKCMGSWWSQASCVDYFCYIFPDSQACQGGNPCKLPQPDKTQREDCCDIKFACCQMWNIANPVGQKKCQDDRTLCYQDACR